MTLQRNSYLSSSRNPHIPSFMKQEPIFSHTEERTKDMDTERSLGTTYSNHY